MFRFVATHDWLTTAQLSQHTGVPPGTLRQWEARHGFPVPARIGSGRHRYSRADAAAVREVIRLRKEGLSMPAAIERARARPAPLTSIFAALRERSPDVQPVAVGKRALLRVTRAIEDEYLALAQGGLLIGSFQRERFYRQSETRWIELARTAELAVVLADFPAYREPPHAPVEVPVARDHHLARDWTVIVHSAGSAVVAGLELPAARPVADSARQFEVLWSFEPEVVYEALRAAVGIVGSLAPAVAARLSASVGPRPTVSSPETRFGSRLALRTVGYLTRGSSR
jgi:DICT domain-containing protein